MSLRPLGWSGSEIVFVAGAPSSATVVVRYNPATGRWRATKAAACKLQGQIVWAGGRLVTGCGADRVQIYNPSSDSLSTIKSRPSPLSSREGSAIAWTGTELIVWSGQTATRFNPTPGDGASLVLGRAPTRASASVTSAQLVYERDFRTSHTSADYRAGQSSHAQCREAYCSSRRARLRRRRGCEETGAAGELAASQWLRASREIRGERPT